MRRSSLVLACALLLTGASAAGTSRAGLPEIGTFTYIGSSGAGDASVALASR